MEAVVMVGLIVTFVFIIFSNLIKNHHLRKVLKIYAEKDLLSSSSEFKFCHEQKEQKSPFNFILPICLSVMGFALGVFISMYLVKSNPQNFYEIREYNESIMMSLSMFLASVGLLISYIINKLEKK